MRQDELEAWSHHTSRQFNLTMLPGDHFFLRSHSSLLLDANGRWQISQLLPDRPDWYRVTGVGCVAKNSEHVMAAEVAELEKLLEG